jgi:hypothetical protein
MSVLSVEQTTGERLFDILKPVAADEIRVGQRRAQIGGISGAALLLGDINEPRPVYQYNPVSVEPN